MAIVRRIRPARPVDRPRRILVVQLDHLGDAVLSTPLLAELRAAYPEAQIDVLASPSNHEVFEADPNIDRVQVAERTWFERSPDRWDLLAAVWKLGRSCAGSGYDLGIDVRGDVLTVLVLALAGVPRRVGWAMGGGAFLLTDVAEWIPGRHEVRSRLAFSRGWGSRRICRRAWTSTSTTRIGSRSPAGWPKPGRAAMLDGIEAHARSAPRTPRSRNAEPRPPSRPLDVDRRCGRLAARRPVFAASLRCWPCTSEPGTRPSAGRPVRGRS